MLLLVNELSNDITMYLNISNVISIIQKKNYNFFGDSAVSFRARVFYKNMFENS